MAEITLQKHLAPGLHVILGDSAAGTFTQTFGAGDALIIDRDVLSCGPTLRCDDIQAWRKMRSAFWNGVPYHSAEATDFGLLDRAEKFTKAERITIWAATGVSEQLFIAHVLHRAQEWGVDVGKIQLVQFETLPNRPSARVLGTGELNKQNMSEHPEPVPISDDLLQDYRAAWAALTSPNPAHIEQFSEANPAANQWLKQAMKLLLRRYPDKRSGMFWWDSALLREVRAHGPKAARIVGYTMGEAYDDADLVGDLYLFGRLLQLGDSLPAPLLEITGDRTNMRDVEAKLTPFGLRVLEGEASNYPANPIEDYVAGVKLSSKQGALWFYNDGALTE